MKSKMNLCISGLALASSITSIVGAVDAQNSGTLTRFAPPPIVGQRLIDDKDVTAAFRDYYGNATQVQSAPTKVLTTSTPQVTTETITLSSDQSGSTAKATQVDINANSQGYLVPQIQPQFVAQPQYVQQQLIAQPQYIVQPQYIQQPQYVAQPQYIQQQQYVAAPVQAPRGVNTATQYYVSYAQKVIPTVETRTVQVMVNKTVRVPQYYKANVYTKTYQGPVMQVQNLPAGIAVPMDNSVAIESNNDL